jgi:SpoVK/Ycf46/Vps4 family AAA+-type ATPase
MDSVEYIDKLREDMVHLSRVALSGRTQDVQLFLRQAAKRYKKTLPELSEALTKLLREAPTRSSPLRKGAVATMPVDIDSRLQLARHEVVVSLPTEPIFDEAVVALLSQIVSERKHQDRLERSGLTPARTALFTGEPGVGKSLAAKWIARELGLPLLTLDLAAVMSSFLGRTGNNVRNVLDYAKGAECVLFLDELDAIAKRRDDATEVGELKRLVTVLLQEIDDWPPDSLLVAATNHSTLLDPAVWRRFDVVVPFPMPTEDATREAVAAFLGDQFTEEPVWIEILVHVLRELSFSDIEREVMRFRRSAILNEDSVEETLQDIIRQRVRTLSRTERGELAVHLVRSGLVSQRQAHDLTGVSRDTIRNHM